MNRKNIFPKHTFFIVENCRFCRNQRQICHGIPTAPSKVPWESSGTLFFGNFEKKSAVGIPRHFRFFPKISKKCHGIPMALRSDERRKKINQRFSFKVPWEIAKKRTYNGSACVWFAYKPKKRKFIPFRNCYPLIWGVFFFFWKKCIFYFQYKSLIKF